MAPRSKLFVLGSKRCFLCTVYKLSQWFPDCDWQTISVYRTCWSPRRTSWASTNGFYFPRCWIFSLETCYTSHSFTLPNKWLCLLAWYYLVMNWEEVIHVTGHRSGNIYKFLLLRHTSAPLGKTVTAAGLRAITEKTGHTMKFTARRTYFTTWKSIGPLESPQKHDCITHIWSNHYHQLIYGQMWVRELQWFS